jgi:hypothetical protein
MRSTLRNLVLAPVVLAAAALAANTAMAAEANFNVPFKFSVAGKICPAGAYRINEDSIHGMVTLRSVDASHSFTWLIRAGDPEPGDKHVTLRFDQQGESFALQSVQYHSLITARLDKAGPKSEHKAVTVIEGQ